MLSKEDRNEMQQRLHELHSRQNEIHPDKKIKRKDENAPNIMRYTHLGVEFILIFLGFMFLGRWLDSQFQTSPWLFLTFLVIGFSGAMYRLIAVANELSK